MAEIAIWKWRDGAQPGDPRAVFREFQRGRAEPSITNFDRAPLLRELRSSFGGIVDRLESPFPLRAVEAVAIQQPVEVVFFPVTGSRAAEAIARIVLCAAHVGLVVFDPSPAAQALIEPLFLLSVENERPVYGPRLEDIVQAVARFHPSDGPTMLFLEAPNRDFVRVAGEPRALAIDWREHSSYERYEHFVAGRPSGPRGIARIQTREGIIAVPADEVLDAKDAAQILSAFYWRRPRPPSYEWRNSTENYARRT